MLFFEPHLMKRRTLFWGGCTTSHATHSCHAAFLYRNSRTGPREGRCPFVQIRTPPGTGTKQEKEKMLNSGMVRCTPWCLFLGSSTSFQHRPLRARPPFATSTLPPVLFVVAGVNHLSPTVLSLRELGQLPHICCVPGANYLSHACSEVTLPSRVPQSMYTSSNTRLNSSLRRPDSNQHLNTEIFGVECVGDACYVLFTGTGTPLL